MSERMSRREFVEGKTQQFLNLQNKCRDSAVAGEAVSYWRKLIAELEAIDMKGEFLWQTDIEHCWMELTEPMRVFPRLPSRNQSGYRVTVTLTTQEREVAHQRACFLVTSDLGTVLAVRPEAALERYELITFT